MAVNRFTGKQRKVAQVTTIQVTAYDAATTYKIHVPDSNGPFVSTIAAGSVNATAAALATAWNAATDGPFPRVTASSSTDTVTLTADEAGEPFTVASAVSGGTGTIGAASTTTANKSPSDLNDAVNWSNNATPANSDTVYLDDVDIPLLWNLDALTTTPTSLTVYGTYEEQFGLPEINAEGNYPEYRGKALTLKPATVNIGSPDGSGPSFFRHTNAATACTWNIFGSGGGVEAGIPAVLLLGTSASNVLNVHGGSVGFAYFGGESGNLSGGVNISGGSLICGADSTLSGVIQSGGDLDTWSALGAVTQRGGSHVHRAGNVTALVLDSGTFICRNPAAFTMTDLTIGPTGVLDLTEALGAVTVTNTAVLRPGATIIDPNNRLAATFTYTAQGGPNSVNVQRGPTSATVALS